MGIVFQGNYIFVEKDSPKFLVASNYTNYFSLGPVNEFYLEGWIEEGKFIVSGTLFNSEGTLLARIVRNQLEDSVPDVRYLPVGDRGYKVVDASNRPIFELWLLDENTCVVKGDFYDSQGTLVARGDDEDFRIFMGPAVLGKSGSSLGIVLEG